MLKKIGYGSVSPGTIGHWVDSPKHDCMSWLAPPGHLEGPNRDCTRSLRAVDNKAVEKCGTGVDHDASSWENKRREERAALRRGLRTRCNRRRNSARLPAYRTLRVYMDGDVSEASLERVVVATDAGNAMDSDAAVAVPGTSSTGYRLKIKDEYREMERALDLSGVAASFVAELLLLEPSQVWTSVREACAACLKSMWMRRSTPSSCAQRASRPAMALSAACATNSAILRRVTLTFRMRKPARSLVRHVMIPPRCMLRVQHHVLAPTHYGASVTDHANVQLPTVDFCSFLFLSLFFFLVGFSLKTSKPKERTSLPRIIARDHHGQYERKCSSVNF